MNKTKKMQRMIRYYKNQTGETEVDMKKVVKLAVSMGWKLPVPASPLDRLAKEFTKAARDEIRHDETTGKPYRANHALPVKHGNTQLHLWIDIDEAPRKQIVKSLIMRREQMVGDGLQLTLDADHWNNIHSDQEPVEIPMDFTDDILWRKNAPNEEEKAA